MNRSRISRLALAVYDKLAADNLALRGDLLEECAKGRSRWWLWRQVIGAVVFQPGLRPSLARVGTASVVVALLLLLSFEAVLVTNLVARLMFGPPFPNISGYLYFFHRADLLSEPESRPLSIMWFITSALVIAAAWPMGRLLARLHERHGLFALSGFTFSVGLCAAITFQAPFLIQFLTMLGCVFALLVGATYRSPGRLIGKQ